MPLCEVHYNQMYRRSIYWSELYVTYKLMHATRIMDQLDLFDQRVKSNKKRRSRKKQNDAANK